MKRFIISKLCVIILALALLAHTQRVTGCIRYELIENDQIRCAQCFALYGLTQQYTCEPCPTGTSLVAGKCIDPAQSAEGAV